jgi:hypothetical protein
MIQHIKTSGAAASGAQRSRLRGMRIKKAVE